MKKDGINIAVITFVFTILAVLLYGKSGNMLIDFSRESFIPYQIIQGQKLNHDIFLIYGAFGYFLNSLLYKISVNINLILIEAIIIAYSISILFYFILKKFTKRYIALIFTLFLIVVSIFSDSNFSFVVPYSYSTLWAVFGLYLILFSYLYKKTKLTYITLGFIAVNKIEFFIFALIFILADDLFNKKFKFKNYLLTLILPTIFLIGFNFNDFINNLNYINTMLHTPSIKTLYRGMGCFYNFEFISYNLFYLAIYIIAGTISYFLFEKHKILSILLLIILFIKVHPVMLFHTGIFLALLLTFINRKKIKRRDIILLVFAIILSSKSIFALSSVLYSNFGYALTIFYIIRQCYQLINKKWVIAHFITLFIIFALWQYIDYLKNPKIPFKTSVGTIQLRPWDSELYQKIDEFFKNNYKENEKFIVIPEGQTLNLIYKTPWNYYNSTFTPLDFETFKEDYLINKLKEDKTDYIIIYPRNTTEYGARSICYDYAVDFCTYIVDNYEHKATYGDTVKVMIFKRNEK